MTALALLRPQRLEHSHGFGPAPEQKIADRAADKSFRPLRCGNADAGARPELLVDRLEAGRRVDGVAVSCVIIEPAAAEIPDNRGPRMNTDAGDARRRTWGPPVLPIAFGVSIERERAGDRPACGVRLVGGRAEQHMDGVADDLGDRALAG